MEIEQFLPVAPAALWVASDDNIFNTGLLKQNYCLAKTGGKGESAVRIPLFSHRKQIGSEEVSLLGKHWLIMMYLKIFMLIIIVPYTRWSLEGIFFLS